MADQNDQNSQGNWLPVSDAAEATGWGVEQLRSRARRGTIMARRGNRTLEVLVRDGRPVSMKATADRWPTTGQPTAPVDHVVAPADLGDQVVDRIDQLREELAKLRQSLDEAQRDAREHREAADRWRTRLEAAEVEVGRAREQAKAAAAVAIADAAAARAVVEGKEELVAELRAELQRARRPFWRRWLG